MYDNAVCALIYMVLFMNNAPPPPPVDIESDSDIDLHDNATAEATCSRSEYPLKSEEMLRNKSDSTKGDNSQDALKGRTIFTTTDDRYSMEMDSSEKLIKNKHGALPVMLLQQSQSSSSLPAGQCQSMDVSSAYSHSLLKFGAPLLLHSGQFSVKPEDLSTVGMGHVLSSLPGISALDNGVQSSQSITSSSPFMFHLSQHMLASQVRCAA